MKGAPENPEFGPATGDSGVIDAFGLGGQGLRHAPSLQSAFAEWLDKDDDPRARSMLAGLHPILETPFALDAAAVAKIRPLATAVDRHGVGRRARPARARGLRVTASLFQSALSP
jgi:hypothetical protein